MHGLIGIGARVLGFLAVSSLPVHAESRAWLQYVADGVEARVITDSSICPQMTVDGNAVAMTVRAGPSAGFATTVCSTKVPPAAVTVRVENIALQMPVSAPKRIAIVGDTGCRLKGIYIQACNDPLQWPFRKIADAIAAKAPDLIIHVGDYHYRETPCPLGDAGCAGSPSGDSWDVWREDFFTPAARLLARAPWVMVRGNHEVCGRGGIGWTRMLEAAPFDLVKPCAGTSAPFLVRLADMTLAVVDTSGAPEPIAAGAVSEEFRGYYAGLETTTSGPVWLLQHRPIWSAGGMVAGLPFGDNKTLAAAARSVLPKRVQLILSGHHHVFQVVSYYEDLPAQIVVGHGGDYLNKGRSTDPAGWSINGVTVKRGVHQVGQFGFAMMEADAATGQWGLSNYDTEGMAMQRCNLSGRDVTCVSE